MLSFLREHNTGDLPAQDSGADTTKAPDPTVNVSEQGFIPVAANSKRVKKTTTLLAVLFVAGLLCIWLMAKKTSPQAANAAAADTNDIDIAKAISHITGVKSEMFNRMDEIVNKFYEFSDVLQVDVSELVKNPFELEMFLAGLKAKAEADEQLVQVDFEAIRRQKIQQAADKLLLMSIMESDQGYCCMIDAKTLYENDTIGDFKVLSISNNSVKLLWNPVEPEHEDAEKVEIELKLAK